MDGIGDGRMARNRGGKDPWRIIAPPALGAAIGFALALALPARPQALPAAPVMAGTCPATAMLLPPGHPPIPGQAAMPAMPGLALPPGHPPIPGFTVAPPLEGPALPPGHPPVQGPGGRAGPRPAFGADAPDIVEI